MREDGVTTVPETAEWAAGPAYDKNGVPRPPMRDVVCEVCGDHSLRAATRTHVPTEQWAATHARHSGHRDFIETTTGRLRAVRVAYEQEAGAR
jgi:hypothetical protein